MAERLNRAAIIERAVALVDQSGLDALTIASLGRDLGISAPGVYRHAKDLADITGAVGHEATRALTQVLAMACAGRSGFEAFEALCRGIRTWAHEHPGLYAALQVAPDPDDVHGQKTVAELLEVFSAALRGYGLGGDDLTDAIRIVRSAVHGFVTLEQSAGFKLERSLEDTFTRLIAVHHEMLRSLAS